MIPGFHRTLTLAVLTLLSAGSVQSPAAETAERSAETAAARFTPSVYKGFAEWKAACDKLPGNRALNLRLPPKQLLPLKSFAQVAEPLDAFIALSKTGHLARTTAWLGATPVRTEFFDTSTAYFLKPQVRFQPFAQRLVVPPGSKVLFHGDLHGDIHSLNAWIAWLNEQGYMKDFRLARPDVYMVLLGDYTDRGMYGVEVLYAILRLKIENPDRVILVRGNHEDVDLAARYGFLAEAAGKYGRDFDAFRAMRIYDFLPVVLYLGCGTTFVQCNHGGMEPGFNPGQLLDAPDAVQYQFLGELTQANFVESQSSWASTLPREVLKVVKGNFKDFIPESPTVPSVLGFMWNDFSLAQSDPDLAIDPDRAFIYGEKLTRLVLDHASTDSRRVHAVFRAHQHSSLLTPIMRRLKTSKGVFRHWQESDAARTPDEAALAKQLETAEERSLPANSVWTFNVSPDSVYGEGCDFSFDTFGILSTAASVSDWRLRVVNLTIAK